MSLFIIVPLDEPAACTEAIDQHQVSVDTFLARPCGVETQLGYRDPRGKVHTYCADHMPSGAQQLDRCPFCGADVEFMAHPQNYQRIAVECHNCGASSAYENSQANAARIWNDRTPGQRRAQQLLAAVRAYLDGDGLDRYAAERELRRLAVEEAADARS